LRDHPRRFELNEVCLDAHRLSSSLNDAQAETRIF
jgi:hypothetical protein